MNTFSNLLKQHLARIGASSYWLAERIGVSAQTVDNWRNGKNKPHKQDKVRACAHYLRLDEDETNAFLRAAGFGEGFVELHERIYADYLQGLLGKLKHMPVPVLLLTSQAGWGEPPCRKALLARAELSYGAANVLQIQPPYSMCEDPGVYFSHLGRACSFADVEDGADFEEALLARLEHAMEPLFLLVSRFEQGGRHEELAGILRNLCEVDDQRRLHIILAGAEKLLELKYAQGSMSLLNLAQVEPWPELGRAEAAAWHQARFPDTPVEAAMLDEFLALSGGHPQLLSLCFALHCDGVSPAEYPARLGQADAVWQAFVPFLEDTAERRRLCGLLENEKVAEMEPFIRDPLVRRLYWRNLIYAADRRVLRWRCEAIREAGRKIIGCTGSGS